MDPDELDNPKKALIPTAHKFISIEGGELEGCELDGVWYVAMRRACLMIGVDWEGQHLRIRRDPILNKGICMMKIPSAGGIQETLCLRLDFFWGWLFKLELSRLDPDVREMLIPFQTAGYQALRERFSGNSSQSLALIALADQVAALAADVAQLKAQQGTWGGLPFRMPPTGSDDPHRRTRPLHANAAAIIAVVRQANKPIGPADVLRALRQTGHEMSLMYVRVRMRRLAQAGRLIKLGHAQYIAPPERNL